MMRIFTFVLTFVVIAFGMAHAVTSNCVDGTKYFTCSSNITAESIGMRCMPSGMNEVKLVRDPSCKCENTPGYVTEGTDTADQVSTCVLAKCGNINMGACDQSNKPKMCTPSGFVDNATKCGCPDPVHQMPGANGLSCIYRPCNDSGESILDTQCSFKTAGKKCEKGVLIDKASECQCDAGQTNINEICTVTCSGGAKNGDCVLDNQPKECVNGYLLDNALKCGCPDGLSAVGKQCANSILGSTAGADLLGAEGGNGTNSAAGGSSALSCCCLPTALIGIIGGFAFFRREE